MIISAGIYTFISSGFILDKYIISVSKSKPVSTRINIFHNKIFLLL